MTRPRMSANGAAKGRRRSGRRTDNSATDPTAAAARDYWRLWLRNGRAPSLLAGFDAPSAAPETAPETEPAPDAEPRP